jgi:hypothetical protein
MLVRGLIVCLVQLFKDLAGMLFSALSGLIDLLA